MGVVIVVVRLFAVGETLYVATHSGGATRSSPSTRACCSFPARPYEVCRRRPEVALDVIAVLARRLRGFAVLIEDLSLRDVTARVAHFLMHEGAEGTTVAFQLLGTREEIGTRVGTVRELISRSLASLQGAGGIELRGRRVRVLDRRRLAALAGLTPSR